MNHCFILFYDLAILYYDQFKISNFYLLFLSHFTAYMYYYDDPKGMIPTWLINWAAKVLLKNIKHYGSIIEVLGHVIYKVVNAIVAKTVHIKHMLE